MIQKYLSENAEYNYFRKDVDWRDEREYRIACWNKLENENFGNTDVTIKGCLRAIVLGINNKDKDIIKIAHDNDIRVFQLVFDEYIFFREM